MRTCILAIAAVASSLRLRQPAEAKDKDIGFKKQSEISKTCDDAGGSLWSTSDGTSYGCGYKGGGGIICDVGGKDNQGKTVPPSCTEVTREAGLDGRLGLADCSGSSACWDWAGGRTERERIAEPLSSAAAGPAADPG